MTVKNTNETKVLVTYRRRLSGRTFQMAFDCGAENSNLILKEAWNTNSAIVTVEAI